MPTFNNIKDLEKMLDPYLQKAAIKTRDEIFEIVSRKVLDYYEEPVFSDPDPTEPDYYSRTGKLLESLTASHVTKTKNGYEFTVGWDSDYLSFRYNKGFTTKRYGNRYNGITGTQVLQAFNTGTHGFTVDGEHNYFDEAIDEINSRGGADGIFIKHLKKLGVPIT